MKFEKLSELIQERITGEWGIEPRSGGVKVIRTTNFTNEGKLDLTNVVVRDIEQKKIEKKALLKGDIIIEKSGGGPTQPVGRVVFFDIDSNEKFLCNNFTTILRPNNSLVESKYLLYQMLYLHKSGRTKKYQNKTTGIHNLSLEKYLQERIALPPLSNQRHIAGVLSKVENLIIQRKESIRLLDEFLKSTFSDFFDNPVKNRKNFPIVKLSEITTFLTSGGRGWGEYYCETGERFIRSLDVQMNYISNDDAAYVTPPNNQEANRTKIQDFDILLTITGSKIGRVAMVPANFGTAYVSQHVAIIRTKNVNPLYLSYYLSDINSGQYLIQKSFYGQTKPGLNFKQIENFEIIIPPISLQTQFVQIVQKTEALKAQYHQSLLELEHLYGSLSQRAFNGELTFK